MQMEQGVTDIGTAKTIARKLYQEYANGGKFEKNSIERMMVDTYKILNKEYRPTGQDIGIYGNILDADDNGVISVEDFEQLAVKYLVRVQARNYTKAVQQRLDVAKRLFLKFDVDRDGYLSEKEIPGILIETYQSMNQEINPTPEDVQSWIQMTDIDGDGRVSLQDYEALIVSSLAKCGIKIYERE